MFKFLGNKIRELFKGKVDEEALEELEELFFQSDLGTQISSELMEQIRALYRKKPTASSEDILSVVKRDLITQLESIQPSTVPHAIPHIILIVGVNGNGKTTTIAKLGHHFQKQGKKVLVAAADTYRAAAIDQLEKWALKTEIDLVKGKHGSDPASVAFDAIMAAKSRNKEVVLIDTAGRLHTKLDLMKELEKIQRVCGKACPGAPHETYLVLDATIGQNGLEQASVFHRFTPLSGLILTKLDGTAKGGTAIAIQRKLQLPIKYIGTGETLDDLQPFNPTSYVNSLFV